MSMDPKYRGFSYHTCNSILDEQLTFQNPNQYLNTDSEFRFFSPFSDLSFISVPSNPPDSGQNDLGVYFASSSEVESFESSPGWSPEGDASSSSSSDRDYINPVLKYISQMLMEENMEDKPHASYDSVALTATEKSLYDVLGEQYPFSNSPQPHINHESPDSDHLGSTSDCDTSTSTGAGVTITGATTSYIADPRWIADVGGSNPVSSQTSISNDYHFQSNSQFFVNPSTGLPEIGNGLMCNSSVNETLLQFNKGLEEPSRFLPKDIQLGTDPESNTFITEQKEEGQVVIVKEDKIETTCSSDRSRATKNHEREDSDLDQGRNSKQSATYVEESDLSEMFDKVLLWPPLEDKKQCYVLQDKQEVASQNPKPDEQLKRLNGGKTRAKKQSKKKETVDLRTLNIICAQAVSANDVRTANELLKQIREHSSPWGDGSQRLAHYFANGLEARLAGSGIGMQNFYTSIASRKTTAADLLNAYKTHLNACPYKMLSIIFANKMILRAAEKATTLHIIDFGVLYGFQWPILIQHLSVREGGPPKLRITGIELPQHGFRLAQRIQDTGRRLAKYCERFNVPFEYRPIAAQNWERIPIEDLKINRNEVLAVNCLGRFKNLPDESFEDTCPRDAVLELIRKINPKIFVHFVVNGTYNTPFFVTRFREALFHFSSQFDMFDCTIPRENQERILFEREFFGREAMNVVACEGNERVERPESYKQWHSRSLRAGLKPLPLDQEVIETCREKMKKWYHKDFVLDEDSNWMLQGWKGRIINASSCWVPA
ncbi:hypothetical protein JCGZ_02978 [Jatropha curcas]|uniref:GRAS02 protein n=1 Tax=Jatropha curcas TaxID=180498 RepID=A0A067L4X7_JATCU|nr:GRAS02 protein [Jatropha curcas]KDP42248.1 hypothetical protein JCGZ_02978 [Jatropha curcas]